MAPLQLVRQLGRRSVLHFADHRQQGRDRQHRIRICDRVLCLWSMLCLPLLLVAGAMRELAAEPGTVRSYARASSAARVAWVRFSMHIDMRNVP